MAENEHTPAEGERNIRIEATRLVFEVRIVLESVAGGLEAITALPEAGPVTQHIEVLRKLVTQAAEAVEEFAAMLKECSAS